MLRDKEMSYNGVTYFCEKDYEEDNIKIFHSYVTVFGERGCFPYSPYSNVSFSTFQRWVDMGMPTRDQMGGHHESDHVKYYNRWTNDQIDKLLVQGMTDAL